MKPAKPEPVFEMSVAQLRATQTAVAKEVGRYALNCVQVDDKGVVGTDGRRMVFVPHDEGQKAPDSPVLVQGAFLKKLKALFKPSRLKTTRRAYRHSPNRLEVEQREEARADYAKFFIDGSSMVGRHDKLSARLDYVRSGKSVQVVEDGCASGEYPNWWDVAVRNSKGMTHVAIDPDYVIEALKALKECIKPEARAVLMSVKDEDSGVVFTVKSGASALVMPIDHRFADYKNRPFLKDPEEKPEPTYDEYCEQVLAEPLQRFLNRNVRPRTKIHKAAVALKRELDKRLSK